MAIARRIGLEQEFFLVDEVGHLSHAADEFLERCQVIAPAWGCRSGEFVPKFVKSMVEISTSPAYTVPELAQSYLKNLRLAIQVGHEMGLRLYPLSSYPLAIAPLMRENINYHAQARTLGYERAAHAGRCTGTHFHLEAPPGSIDSRVGVSYQATSQARTELLNLYNLATALDPALIAFSRACPFYEGQLSRESSHVVRYRGDDAFEWDGVFTKVPIAGGLRPYADSIETLVELQFARHYGWLNAMIQAGVDCTLFLNTGGSLLKSAWNPVRLNALGTVEVRSIDSNYPEWVIALITLINRLVTRVREESWTIRPSRKAYFFQSSGDELLVPEFDFLNSILLYSAVTTGINHPYIQEYIASILEFAFAGDEENSALIYLKTHLDHHQTTASEILKEFPTTAQLSEIAGLSLVRQCCDRLEKQVLSLSEKYSLTIPNAVDAVGV